MLGKCQTEARLTCHVSIARASSCRFSMWERFGVVKAAFGVKQPLYGVKPAEFGKNTGEFGMKRMIYGVKKYIA